MLNVNRIFIFIILMQTLSFAEATLTETIEFIQKKLNVQTNYDYGDYTSHRTIQSFINNGNCNFTIKIVNVGMEKINDIQKGVYGSSKKEYTFNAKDLDPTNVYLDEANSGASEITMDSLEHKKKISLKRYIYEPKSKNKKSFCVKEKYHSIKFLKSNRCILTTYDDEVIIPYLLSPHSDNRPRVIKAMKHLIKICGGKGELF